MWDPYAEIETVVLPNGLTIYCSQWPNREFESAHFLIHSGSHHDPEQKPGVAHFVEHVVSYNGKETHDEKKAFFRPFGGRVNFGETRNVATKYGFMLPSDPNVFSRALDQFGHMLLGSKLKQDIESERTIIFAEFRRKFPSERSWLDFREELALLTQSGALAKMTSTLGTLDSIQNITQADLQVFYDAHYTPANMSVVCVGGMSVSEITALFEASPFARLIPGIRTPLLKIQKDVSKYVQRRKEVSALERNPLTNTTVCKFRTQGMIPGTFHSEIVCHASILLGKKLMQELREIRRWVYDVHVSHVSILGMYYVFGIACEGVELSVIDQVEDVIDEVISSLHQCEMEFHEMRQSIRAGYVYSDPTVNGITDGILDDLVVHQQIETITERRAMFETVSFQDMLSLLSFLEPDRRWTCITRP